MHSDDVARKTHNVDASSPRRRGNHSSPRPKQGGDPGSLMMIGLVVLSLIASIIMLFTDSQVALKLALLAALWAAVLGFFLVGRYRKTADDARRELVGSAGRSGLASPAEADLIRERDAANERADHAAEALAAREKQDDANRRILIDIQRELSVLRNQLEELAGREYTYEPAALHAQAYRVHELEADTSNAAARIGSTDRDFQARDFQARDEVKHEPGHVTGAPSADAISGRLGSQDTPRNPKANPLASLISEREAERKAEKQVQQATKASKPAATKPQSESARDDRSATFDTGSFAAIKWDQGGTARSESGRHEGGHHESNRQREPRRATAHRKDDLQETAMFGSVESQAGVDKDPKAGNLPGFSKHTKPDTPEAGHSAQPIGGHRKPDAEAEEGRRGRRRRDDNEPGLSVAELMARSRKDR